MATISPADGGLDALQFGQQALDAQSGQSTASQGAPSFIQMVDLQLAQANAGTTQTAPANASGVTTIPASPAAAPKQINLSTLEPQFAAQNQTTVDSKVENGGTITATADGQLQLVNKASGGGTEFKPNYDIPKDQKLVGIFHTHPVKDANEHNGMSFSGSDTAELINKKSNIIMAESNGQQFVLMRTDKTPASVDSEQLQKAQLARQAQLVVGQGKSVSEATKITASEMAQKYGLAYYEGRDGILNQVEYHAKGAENFKWDAIR